MPAPDEAAVLALALEELGLDEVDVTDVLADHPGRRRVVRAGDLVVKAFAAAEGDAFRRERAGLRALADTALAPPLVATGRRWSATRCVDGVVPMHLDVDAARLHAALGPVLAALHEVVPVGLEPWPVVDRLRRRLADPPASCPPRLVAAVGRLVDPLLALVVDGAFVHGDWGTANVLVDRRVPTHVLAVIDFEDAHRGDPAEDLRWQVLAGPTSVDFVSLAGSYGRGLGPHATERLVVAGAELCLDVLGWSMAEPARTRFHDRCRATLDELVGGTWPAWPHA